jgi:hypothetical protein
VTPIKKNETTDVVALVRQHLSAQDRKALLHTPTLSTSGRGLNGQWIVVIGSSEKQQQAFAALLSAAHSPRVCILAKAWRGIAESPRLVRRSAAAATTTNTTGGSSSATT